MFSAIATFATPASAGVVVRNFAQANTQIVDHGPLYAYNSGTTASWLNNTGFSVGTFTNAEISKEQVLVSAQITGGVPSVRTYGQGSNEFNGAWSPPYAPGLTGVTRVSVAASPAGLVAMAVIVSGAARVLRQTSPGVWPTTPVWTTVAASVADMEIAFEPDGLLIMSYMNTAGTTLAIEETAANTWGTAVNLGGTVTRTTIAVYPDGSVVEAGIGGGGAGMYTRIRAVSGTWSAWVLQCTAAGALSDISIVVRSGRAVIYGASASGIYKCSQPASGAWTVATAVTGSYTTIGAAALTDGRVELLGHSGGVQATAVEATVGGAFSAWTAINGAYTDQELDGYFISQGVSTKSTGGVFATSGTWESQTIDTGTAGSGIYGVLQASTNLPTGTNVRFQVAASGSGTPSTFIGPDGTAGTTYPSEGGPLPYSFDGLRYFRVKALLSGTTTATPELTGVKVNYNLTRVPRNAEGTFAVTGRADATSWLTRVSAASTSLSTGVTTLVDAPSSAWGTSSFGAKLDSPAATCCSPSQFNVVSGTSTATGSAGVAPTVSGVRLGQSTAFTRTNLNAGSGTITQRTALSSSLLVEWPQVINLDRDLAIGATATQSSAGLAPASRAVDGNTDGAWANNSVSHTAQSSQPWLQVDLGSSQALSEVRLWNRTDCCSARLSDYALLLSNSPITTTSYDDAVSSTAAAGGSVNIFIGASQRTEAKFLPAGTTARYIVVILRSSSVILSLAELEAIPA